MKRLLLACAAVALLAPGAAATTGSCLDLADPVGDVYGGLSVHAQPTGVYDGVDMTNVRVEATTSAVTLVFSVHGAPDPAPAEAYTFRLEFDDGTDFYMFSAETTGAGLRLPRGTPFELRHRKLVVNPDNPPGELSTWENLPATGSVDLAAKTVTISAPASSFGSLTSGQQWDVTRVESLVGLFGSKIDQTDVVDPTGTTIEVGTACA